MQLTELAQPAEQRVGVVAPSPPGTAASGAPSSADRETAPPDGWGSRASTAAASSTVAPPSFRMPHVRLYGSCFGGGLPAALRSRKRRYPFSHPSCGIHSTDARSASAISWGPADFFDSSAHPFHSSRTRSPSNVAIPSPAVAVSGTRGPGSRYRSLGPCGTRSISSVFRTSSTKYSATPVRSASTANWYGSAASTSCPRAACRSGSAPSRTRSRRRPPLRPGSYVAPASAPSGTVTSPSSCRSLWTCRSRPGTMRTISPSNVHHPSREMTSAMPRC